VSAFAALDDRAHLADLNDGVACRPYVTRHDSSKAARR
jgi:hypothetical protein